MVSPTCPRSTCMLAVVTLTLLSIVGPTLPAQEGAVQEAGVSVEKPRETFFTLIVKGGWIMIPIGLCSIVVLTVSIERAFSLRRSRVATDGLLEEIFEALPSRQQRSSETTSRAAELCDDNLLVDRVIRIGVEKLHRDEAHVEEYLEDAASKEVHRLHRKLRPLAVVAALAPLLGLLGTIYGMIMCFENAASGDAASRTENLASGIYVALVSTAAGMSVAIPSMLFNFYYQGRVDRVTDLLDEEASEFLDHYYAADTADGGQTLSLEPGITRPSGRKARAR